MYKSRRVRLPALCAAAALAAALCGAASPLETPAGMERYLCDQTRGRYFSENAQGRVGPARPGSIPFSFAASKPARLKRVFVLGESAAHVLGAYSPAMPQRRGVPLFEVLNFGMAAYDSWRIAAVLEESLKYKPDLLVVLSGNNEGIPERCEGAAFELRRRKYALLKRLYSIKRTPQEASRQALLDLHRESLDRMAAAAKKAGVPLVFALLPANVRDLPPAGPPPLEEQNFADGYRYLYAGRYAEAERGFRAGLAAGRYPAQYNFYLGKALAGAGRGQAAAQSFFRALDLDESLGRSDAARLAEVRAAAAAGGACTADLAAFFRGLAEDGAPGFSEFSDGIHWRPAYNSAVWRQLLSAGGLCGAAWAADLPPARSDFENKRDDLRKRLSYALAWLTEEDLNQGAVAQLSYLVSADQSLAAEAARSPKDLARLLLGGSWSGTARNRTDYLFPFFLLHLAEAQRRAGRAAAALKLCERAEALKPGLLLTRLARAQLLADLGRAAEARSEFEAAAFSAGLGGETRRLGYGFGDRLPGMRRSAQGEAGAAVKRASEKNAPAAGAAGLLLRCRADGAAGRLQAALSACQAAALAGAPGEAGALDAAVESARLLLKLGREAEAREALRWTLADAPAGWQGLAEAAALLREAGAASDKQP